jgi:hypothetical protein
MVIKEMHCQECGNTENEDVKFRGYSGCCNERVVMPGWCDESCGHTR